ncbi:MULTISPECIES: coiled-coil domain-containing protein [Psychrobacter]|uniref:Uncharacterized protein n=1 Tax=Psychrobacter pocilloporae TaxID=1775882 RepID=A0ABT6IQV5_9GAMM|nr:MULTISPECIES: hypothetical protein [Psychrobacter]AOY44878.1 hypothetical protein AOT82_2499 [Psychrobacter sp. AntiMn-1]MDH4904213.1 hypothetical protein [Psychrobacter pocilloporae]
MSVLIKELEARKDDYILVADVINTMANATNSTPDEVVKYLDAHNIDEHLTLLYMDESYNFEPYNGYFLGLGNDANITYFQKSDVMAFEPITKHGIFKGSQAANDMVHDVYGRTYDITQHKKNREDDYLTLSETIQLINTNINPNNESGLSVDNTKLRDLARKKKITPCFYYHGYVGELDYQGVLHTEVIAAYFTYRLLTEEICGYDDYMKLPSDGVKIYRVIERKTAEFADYDDGLFLFYENPNGLNDAEKGRLSHIEADEIRFSKRELDGYIASLAPVSVSDEPTAQDSELLTKLESAQAENDKLNARLNKASDIYRQNQNEIKELKAQLEKAEADIKEFKEQLSNKIDAPDSIDELKGIAKLNIEKPIFISSAKAIADYLWSLDKSEAIRTGDMVQQVKAIMIKVNYDLLPSEDETIRTWLAEVAPPHAKKSGRTPKNAPSEITLTMKK